LQYGSKKKCVSFFDNGKEEKIEIEENNQLYEYSSRIINVIDRYEKKGIATE